MNEFGSEGMNDPLSSVSVPSRSVASVQSTSTSRLLSIEKITSRVIYKACEVLIRLRSLPRRVALFVQVPPFHSFIQIPDTQKLMCFRMLRNEQLSSAFLLAAGLKASSLWCFGVIWRVSIAPFFKYY